jgi:hypothetical protein
VTPAKNARPRRTGRTHSSKRSSASSSPLAFPIPPRLTDDTGILPPAWVQVRRDGDGEEAGVLPPEGSHTPLRSTAPKATATRTRPDGSSVEEPWGSTPSMYQYVNAIVDLWTNPRGPAIPQSRQRREIIDDPEREQWTGPPAPIWTGTTRGR